LIEKRRDRCAEVGFINFVDLGRDLERAHSFWRIRDMARSVGSRVASIALRYMSRKDPTSSPSARNSAKAE
jgi:hypothetical protein